MLEVRKVFCKLGFQWDDNNIADYKNAYSSCESQSKKIFFFFSGSVATLHSTMKTTKSYSNKSKRRDMSSILLSGITSQSLVSWSPSGLEALCLFGLELKSLSIYLFSLLKKVNSKESLVCFLPIVTSALFNYSKMPRLSQSSSLLLRFCLKENDKKYLDN